MTLKLLQTATVDAGGVRSAFPASEGWMEGKQIAEHLDPYAIRLRQSGDTLCVDLGPDSSRIEEELLIDPEKLTARVLAHLRDLGDFMHEDDTLCGLPWVFVYHADRPLDQQTVDLSPKFQIVEDRLKAPSA